MKIVILAIMIFFSGCANVVLDETIIAGSYKMEKLADFGDIIIKINSYGYISFFDTKTLGYGNSSITPDDLKKDIKKAQNWFDQVKNDNTKIDKKLNSYDAENTSLSFLYEPTTKSSFLTLCFKDARYQRLYEYKCGHLDQKSFKSFVELLANDKKIIESLKSSLEAEKKLN